MTKFPIKTIAATLAFAVGVASAQVPTEPAQEIATLPATTEQPHWPNEVWPAMRHTLQVVTLKEPTVRRTCHVQAIEKERILCSRKFGEPTVYNREDIAALIEHTPGDHPWLTFSALFAAGGGIMTGACFLASVTVVGAVPVALLGTVVLLTSWAAFLEDDPPHDTLLYLKPGAELAPQMRKQIRTVSATPAVNAPSAPAAS